MDLQFGSPSPQLTSPAARSELLKRLRSLLSLHRDGRLGGEIMPEDINPALEKGSRANYAYFTLPMALNYQRDSYALWRAARDTYNDESTRFVFDPERVCQATGEEVRAALLKHRLALQPIKHVETWTRLCRTLHAEYGGDVRQLLQLADYSVKRIKTIMQMEKKAAFPYLCGPKICNYWLFVLEQYTDAHYQDRQNISVAPDTHVIQATIRLGLVNGESVGTGDIQGRVAEAWSNLLDGTELVPIDVHTPLWLWSRNGLSDLGL